MLRYYVLRFTGEACLAFVRAHHAASAAGRGRLLPGLLPRATQRVLRLRGWRAVSAACRSSTAIRPFADRAAAREELRAACGVEGT